MNREDWALSLAQERHDRANQADYDYDYDEREAWWADEDADYERWRDQQDG